MQAIQWSIAYPSSVKKILCIAAAPSLTAQNIAFNEIARQAILQDEDFFKGDFYQHNTKPKKGLRIAGCLVTLPIYQMMQWIKIWKKINSRKI